DQSRFQEELGQSSPERLRNERAWLDREVNNLGAEVSRLQEHCGRLDERRRRLEAAEELSVLRQRRNAVLAELNDSARRWSVLAICLHFMRNARELFEKERKQPVVRESEHFFRTITGGRYRSIVAPHDELRIQVVGADGKRYDPVMLSRGTAEQLYLSLRFGYVQEFARRARPLPVVMDDILVNFDPRRARAALEAMLELATSNQVLLFTCHPETVEMVREADGKVPIRRLEGGTCSIYC
ncbi:MAG: ATP-binding protein, partial [Syntrophobacteria bacterium]